MNDTRRECALCNGRGLDEWNGTCINCGGQGREPFREWGKEDDEDQPFKAIFTCLECEANYTVDEPTDECPVCGHVKKRCSHWPGQKRCGVCGMGTSDLMKLHDETIQKLKDWIETP